MKDVAPRDRNIAMLFQSYALYPTLEDQLSNCDIFAISVPLTKEARHLVGKRELATMRKSSILVNTSRGSVIDQDALAAALQNHEIGGAGLDVLAAEPPDPSDPIHRAGS